MYKSMCSELTGILGLFEIFWKLRFIWVVYPSASKRENGTDETPPPFFVSSLVAKSSSVTYPLYKSEK